MKPAKLLVIAFALFFVGCGDSTTTNQTTNATTQSSPTIPPKPSPTAPVDELAAARTSYMQVCSNCHQDDGTGGTVKIEGKPLKVPSLLEGHGLTHTDEEFAKQIANGGDGMPPYKDKFTPAQINDMVRYIRRDIQRDKAPKPKAAK